MVDEESGSDGGIGEGHFLCDGDGNVGIGDGSDGGYIAEYVEIAEDESDGEGGEIHMMCGDAVDVELVDGECADGGVGGGELSCDV